jgi:hypothetical protein
MTLSQLLTEAFDYFEVNGFEDSEQVREWMGKIERAVRESMTPQVELDRLLKLQFKRMFDRAVTNPPGVSRFTVQKLQPSLRALLDKRLVASMNLIKLNRDEMIGATLRRFAGWMSSIPEADRHRFDRAKLREELGKPLKSLPWAERRVMIDQGHKLVASVNATIAEGGGAIAGRWFSHWKQVNYNYRDSHKERDGKVYMLRNSWAVKDGLVKKGPNPWSDEITQPAEEPFCRCKLVYLYHLRQLPVECLTSKGMDAMDRAKRAISNG